MLSLHKCGRDVIDAQKVKTKKVEKMDSIGADYSSCNACSEARFLWARVCSVLAAMTNFELIALV